MAMFSTSVLLQQDKADGTTTTSHTLHWIEASDHNEAIADAVTNAKRLKPKLSVVDVICGNQDTGSTKRVAFDAAAEPLSY